MTNGNSGSDLTGRIFGRLTVVRFWGRSQARKPRPLWLCACSCGGQKSVTKEALMRPKSPTQSCGCLEMENRKRGNMRTHGCSKRIPEYKVWEAMKRRCQNSNDKSYARYGGAGVSVCERWQRFEYFYADMGSRPSAKHSIDRIDSTRGYGPENCRWATATTQQRNRPTFVKMTMEKATELRALRAAGTPLRALAERYGISQVTASTIARGRTWVEQSPAPTPPA